MKIHLHRSDEIFISPQHGWEQMELLLDKKLPVKNKRRAGELYFKMRVAASLIIIFLLSTKLLNNTAIVNSFKRDVSITGAITQDVDISYVNEGKVISYIKNEKDGKAASPGVGKKEQVSEVGLSPESNNLVVRKIVPGKIIKESMYAPMKILPEENLIAKNKKIALLKHTANNDAAGLTKKPDESDQERSWNLSAGLAVNAMAGKQQNFKPYPAAILRYNVSNNFYLSLGLSAGSHVSTQNRAVKKTVYVNDIVNNIKYYNTVNHYYDFAYADIPLLAGLNISKKISLQTGLQASALLKTKSKTFIEQYDFQSRLASVAATGLLTTTAAPVSETDYKVATRKMDYRLTTGIKYNINNLALNLMYQYALQPALTGDITSRNKNQLVTLNLQFKIK